MNFQEKESHPILNGHRLLSRVFAFRRLGLFPSPIDREGPSPLPPIGAVFGTLRVDTARTFSDGAKLLRASELGHGYQRQIDRNLLWIGGEEDGRSEGGKVCEGVGSPEGIFVSPLRGIDLNTCR